jgi:O-antigen/teichoic acid export membrane protein
MSDRRLAVRSVAFNWLGRAASFLISFVLTPIVLKALGREAYGIWAIAMSVGSYYALADFGMRGATVKYIAQFSAINDRKSLDKVLAVSMWQYLGLALFAVLASAVVAWVFPYAFDLHEQSVTNVRWTVFLCGVAVGIRLLGQVFRAVLQALIRFDVRNLLGIAAQLLEAGLMIACVWAGYGLVGMAASMLFVAILDQIAGAIAARQLLGPIPMSLKLWDREIFWKLFNFGSLNIIVNTASRISRFSGPIVIGMILGPATVTFFSLAESLTHKAETLTKSLSSVIMPLSGRLHAQKRRADLVRVYIQSAKILLALASVVSVIFAVMGGRLIDLWIGPGLARETHPILCVMSAAFVVTMVSGGIPSMLTGTGHIKYLARIQMSRALVTVVMSVVLVYWLGAIGVAWSILLPRIVTHLFTLPIYAGKEYGVSWWSYMRQVCVPAALATAPALAIAVGFATFMPPHRLLQWLAQAGVACSAAGVVAFFTCLDPYLQRQVLRMFGLTGRRVVKVDQPQPVQDPAAQ